MEKHMVVGRKGYARERGKIILFLAWPQNRTGFCEQNQPQRWQKTNVYSI